MKRKLRNEAAFDFGPWKTSNQNNLNTFYIQNLLQLDQKDGINLDIDQDNNEEQFQSQLYKNSNLLDENFRIQSKNLLKNNSEPSFQLKNSQISSLQATPKNSQQNLPFKNNYDFSNCITPSLRKSLGSNQEKKRSNSRKRIESNMQDNNYNQFKVLKNDFKDEQPLNQENKLNNQSIKNKISIQLDNDLYEKLTMNLKYEDVEKFYKQKFQQNPQKIGYQHSQTEPVSTQNSITDLLNSEKQRQGLKQKQEFNRQLIQYGQQTLQNSNFLDSSIKEFQNNQKNKIQTVNSPVFGSSRVNSIIQFPNSIKKFIIQKEKQSISDNINNALNSLKNFNIKPNFQDKKFKFSSESFQQNDQQQQMYQKKQFEKNSSFIPSYKEIEKQLKEEKNNQISQNINEDIVQRQKSKTLNSQSSPNDQKYQLLSNKKRPSINTIQLKKLSFNLPICQDSIVQQIDQQIEGINQSPHNNRNNKNNQIENSIYYQYIQQKIINKGIKGQKVRNFFACQKNLLRSCPNQIEINQNQNEQTQNLKTNAKEYSESKTYKQISAYLNNESSIIQKSENSSPTQLIQNSYNNQINDKPNYPTAKRNELAQHKSELSQIYQYLNSQETPNKFFIDQNLNQSLIKVSLLKYNLNSIGGKKFKFKDLNTLPI